MENIPIRHIDTKKQEPDLSETFSIRDVHQLLKGKDMVQELHRHNFFYILALQNAGGSHNIDFTPYVICNNSVFFMRPGQVHQLVLEAESTGYLMQFNTDFYFPEDKGAIRLLRQASKVNHYRLNPDGFKKVHSILTYIFRENAEKNDRYQDIIKANLGIFFIELTRQHSNDTPVNANLYMQERLEKFLELLETNVFTHKQVSEYAAMLNLSTYQLNAISKTALGKTCSEIIDEYIILEAKRCLLATSNQVNQTAYRLGYEDVSYFIRFFKKQTGFSPEAFRNNFR